jgi:hypothetical protein
MRTRIFPLIAACLFLFSFLPSLGQAPAGKQSGNRPPANENKEPGAATFAPNLAAETTPLAQNAQIKRRQHLGQWINNLRHGLLKT